MKLLNSNKLYPWQSALINAITDPQELLELLELDLALLEPAKKAAQQFPLKVPRGFLERIEKGNPEDPLLLQILPLGAELEEKSGYTLDPLQEKKVNPIPGLLHKYPGRVLLTFVSACGINCRYCFRRHFPYANNNPGSEGWHRVFDYIAKDQSINETILSGGDPLVANDLLLKNFILQLAEIPHIKRLRIHSRMPIVLPERITDELIESLSSTRLKTILVVHCNHPYEINNDVKKAMQRLAKAGVVLLNQSVLLKKVNDCVETLASLSEALFDAGILPYYLHVLDKVQGAAHFDLDHSFARQLHWKLNQILPGFLVPKLVSEQPGASAKTTLFHEDFVDLCTD